MAIMAMAFVVLATFNDARFSASVFSVSSLVCAVISDFLISTEIAEALFSRPGRITPGQKSF
jgi:hypothetical protein